MQTTSILRRAGAVLALLIVALSVDVGLPLAFERYATPTDITWHNYRALEPNSIDTLVLGSSFASFGINPDALDAELGSRSYNLATMAQTLPNSLDTLRSALADHKIERVILCIGSDSLQHASQYDREVAFLQAKSLGDSAPDILRNVATLALDEDNFSNSKSLGWIFPWAYTATQFDAEYVADNIRKRLDYPDPTDAMEIEGPPWRYMGDGHCAYDSWLDYQTMTSNQLAIATAEPFRDKNLRELCDLLEFCSDHNLPTYVVIAPHPDYANLALQDPDYPRLMASLKELVEAHGATYLDCNLIDPSIYRPLNEDFSDQEHLNPGGSQHYSTALGSFIATSEANGELKSFSYDDWDAYLDSFDDIELCYTEYEVRDGEVALTAGSVAKPNVEVEYQLEVAHEQEGDYEVAQPFSTESTFNIPIDGNGALEIRVTVRAVGSTSSDDARIWHHTIWY